MHPFTPTYPYIVVNIVESLQVQRSPSNDNCALPEDEWRNGCCICDMYYIVPGSSRPVSICHLHRIYSIYSV